LSARGGNLNRSTGASLRHVASGTVDASALAQLRTLLARPWPASASSLDDAGAEDLVRFRADGVDVLRMPPVPPSALPLLTAFREVEESFRVTNGSGYEGPPPGGDQDPAVPCANLTNGVTPTSVRAGGAAIVTSQIHNCGSHDVKLDLSPCDGGVAWLTVLVARDGLGRSLASEEPGAALPPEIACRDAPHKTITVAPGANATMTRAWNLTFAECSPDGGCAFTPASPGTYVALSTLGHKWEVPNAEFRVLSTSPVFTQLLVGKEYDWLNATTGAPEAIGGDFGGHCAPATYVLDPTVVTLRFSNVDIAHAPLGIVIHDFRDSPRVEHAYSTSADRLALDIVENGSATLRDPFAEGQVPLNVTLDGTAFIANGTRIEPGASLLLRFERDIVQANGSYHATRIVTLTNEGQAELLSEEFGGCM
jgi:hypothetical protein